MQYEIEKLIELAEFKLDTLPPSYFIEWFKDEFIKKLQDIAKE